MAGHGLRQPSRERGGAVVMAPRVGSDVIRGLWVGGWMGVHLVGEADEAALRLLIPAGGPTPTDTAPDPCADTDTHTGSRG